MKDFEAKYPLKHYKSYKTWFYQVYRNNKNIIDAAYGYNPNVKPYTQFKQAAFEFIEQGKSPREAVQTIARSTMFTSKKERLHDFFIESVKSDKEAFKTFRELSKDRGRYTKFNSDDLYWSYTDKAYIYKDEILVSFENSPYGIIVKKLSYDDSVRLKRANEDYIRGRNAARAAKKKRRRGPWT